MLNACDIRLHQPSIFECAGILTFVSDVNANGKEVSKHELERRSEFGTQKVIEKKCNLLVSRGFLKTNVSVSDKRANVLTLTRKGKQFIAHKRHLMFLIIKETKPIF